MTTRPTMAAARAAEDSARRPASMARGGDPPEPGASSPLPGSAAAHAARRCAMMLYGRSAGVVPLAEEHVPLVDRAPPDRRVMRQVRDALGHTARLDTAVEHTPTIATPTRPPASPGLPVGPAAALARCSAPRSAPPSDRRASRRTSRAPVGRAHHRSYGREGCTPPVPSTAARPRTPEEIRHDPSAAHTASSPAGSQPVP